MCSECAQIRTEFKSVIALWPKMLRLSYRRYTVRVRSNAMTGVHMSGIYGPEFSLVLTKAAKPWNLRLISQTFQVSLIHFGKQLVSLVSFLLVSNVMNGLLTHLFLPLAGPDFGFSRPSGKTPVPPLILVRFVFVSIPRLKSQ